MSMAFLITTLIVVATPGAGVIYTLSAGLSHDRRAAVIAAAGCTLAVALHMAATVAGLAALLHASSVAFQTVKYAGVAYLLYMAWNMLRDRGGIAVRADAPPRSAARLVRDAVLLNILNPKVTMFFFAFLPQFVTPGEPGSLLRMVELSGVFMLVTFVVFAGYGICAATVKHHVISRPAVMGWLRRGFAASFVALGLKLALAER